VVRAFEVLDQFGGALEIHAQPEAGVPDDERLAAPWPLAGQPKPQEVVGCFSQGTTGLAPLGLQLGRHVVIEGDSRPHIMMLAWLHQ